MVIFTPEDTWKLLKRLFGRKERKEREEEKEPRRYYETYYPFPKLKAYYILYLLGELTKDKEGNIPKEVYEHVLKIYKSPMHSRAAKPLIDRFLEYRERGANKMIWEELADIYHKVYPLPEDAYRTLKKEEFTSEEIAEAAKKVAEHVEKHWEKYRAALPDIFDVSVLENMDTKQKKALVIGLWKDLENIIRNPELNVYSHHEFIRFIEPFEDKVFKAVEESRYKKILSEMAKSHWYVGDRLGELVDKILERIEKHEKGEAKDDVFFPDMLSETSRILPRRASYAKGHKELEERMLHLDEELGAHYDIINEMIYPLYLKMLEKRRPELKDQIHKGAKSLYEAVKKRYFHFKTKDGEELRFEHAYLPHSLPYTFYLRPPRVREYLKDHDEVTNLLKETLQHAKEGKISYERHWHVLKKLGEARVRTVKG